MRYDCRTREQRKAGASAMIALVCFGLMVLLIAAALSTDAGGAAEAGKLPVVDKLPGEDTPATACSYIDLGELLGEFTLTAYCPCVRCCGKSDGITATSTTATEGRTIAVDPSIIPYGSTVTIHFADGSSHSYIAEDCGGAIRGNRIDVFFDSHRDALRFGVQGAYVYLKEGDFDEK